MTRYLRCMDAGFLQTPKKAVLGGGNIFKEYEMPALDKGLKSGRITEYNIEIIPEP